MYTYVRTYTLHNLVFLIQYTKTGKIFYMLLYRKSDILLPESKGNKQKRISTVSFCFVGFLYLSFRLEWRSTFMNWYLIFKKIIETLEVLVLSKCDVVFDWNKLSSIQLKKETWRIRPKIISYTFSAEKIIIFVLTT